MRNLNRRLAQLEMQRRPAPDVEAELARMSAQTTAKFAELVERLQGQSPHDGMSQMERWACELQTDPASTIADMQAAIAEMAATQERDPYYRHWRYGEALPTRRW